MGATVNEVEVAIDGLVVGHLTEPIGTIDLSVARIAPGTHTIKVTAVGATTRYILDDVLLTHPTAPQPSYVAMPIEIAYAETS